MEKVVKKDSLKTSIEEARNNSLDNGFFVSFDQVYARRANMMTPTIDDCKIPSETFSTEIQTLGYPTSPPMAKRRSMRSQNSIINSEIPC